jgi:drug/metabolite transporter (DMT)-like permease
MTPIFILMLAAALGERIGPRQWAGVTISFCGVYLIATQGRPTVPSFNIGDMMALASMVMWAGYTVLLRVRRDALSVVELIVVVCAFGVLFMLPWVAYEIAAGASVRLSTTGFMAVAYSAIGSLLLAYAGWSYVVRRLGPARAGITLHLMPAMGVVLAAVLLREYPSWFHFAGIAMILAGVALSSLRASSASSSR